MEEAALVPAPPMTPAASWLFDGSLVEDTAAVLFGSEPDVAEACDAPPLDADVEPL